MASLADYAETSILNHVHVANFTSAPTTIQVALATAADDSSFTEVTAGAIRAKPG